MPIRYTVLTSMAMLAVGCASAPRDAWIGRGEQVVRSPAPSTQERQPSPRRTGSGSVVEDCREGRVAYVPVRAMGHEVLVRARPSRRQQIEGAPDPAYYFESIDRQSRNIDMLVGRILGEPATPCTTDDEVWSRFRRLWAWGPAHIRQDLDALAEMNGDRDGWPTITQMTLAERRHGYVPVGTCFSTAHTYATLLARLGVPRDRFAIATAFYGDTASHVYLALFVDGRWHYFDPSFVRSAPALPARVADIDSYGSPDLGVDYAHPISMIFAAADPLGGRLPRLQPEPGYSWRQAAARASGAGGR